MSDRLYDPIRITVDETVNRHNEKLMQMDDAIQDYIIGVVKGEIDPDNEKTDESKKNDPLYVLDVLLAITHGPTWADMLGLEFDEYENWAFLGLGNRAIAERVAEIHAKNKLTKDDTVIIQWTSHLRHDWHATDARHQDNAGWKTSGSLFNYINQEIFDEKWIKTFGRN